ncbi:Uncharacterised protein [Escherichia coli]|uniref:Uncharacterized protein n=1 Tax=Escherichia coli TaxID=562 RepID=A0A376UDR2_ECOLX|nr:Uncharacterised protein [Escherichia coli]
MEAISIPNHQNSDDGNCGTPFTVKNQYTDDRRERQKWHKTQEQWVVISLTSNIS